MVTSIGAPMRAAYCRNGCLQAYINNYQDFCSVLDNCIITKLYIRYTIFIIAITYIIYTIIILWRNYLQIVRFYYVNYGPINESACLSVRTNGNPGPRRMTDTQYSTLNTPCIWLGIPERRMRILPNFRIPHSNTWIWGWSFKCWVLINRHKFRAWTQNLSWILRTLHSGFTLHTQDPPHSNTLRSECGVLSIRHKCGARSQKQTHDRTAWRHSVFNIANDKHSWYRRLACKIPMRQYNRETILFNLVIVLNNTWRGTRT